MGVCGRREEGAEASFAGLAVILDGGQQAGQRASGAGARLDGQSGAVLRGGARVRDVTRREPRRSCG